MSTDYGNPDWLKEDGNTPTAEMSGNSGAFETIQTSTPEPPATPVVTDDDNNKKRGCLSYCNSCISIFFLIIFILSAVFQENDIGDSFAWLLFYAFHATNAALFLVFGCCINNPCLGKPIQFISSSMIVWSIVLVAITSKQLADTASGGPKEGGDSDELTKKQEKAFEVAGATLGLISALYHIIIYRLCNSNKKSE